MKTYKDFLNEDVEQILSIYREQIEYFVSERTDSLFLHKVIVKGKKQGLGSKFMTSLVDYADSVGKRIECEPDKTFGATSVGRLKKFYKRFGFVENKGRNKDYTTSATMYRESR